MGISVGGRERTWTSKLFRAQPPQGCVFTNFTTRPSFTILTVEHQENQWAYHAFWLVLEQMPHYWAAFCSINHLVHCACFPILDLDLDYVVYTQGFSVRAWIIFQLWTLLNLSAATFIVFGSKPNNWPLVIYRNLGWYKICAGASVLQLCRKGVYFAARNATSTLERPASNDLSATADL